MARKMKKMTNNPEGVNQYTKGSMTKKVMIGATGVAITAGAVAAGAALMDRRNRERIAKGAKSAVSYVGEGAMQGYQAVAHTIGMDNRGRAVGRQKSRKSRGIKQTKQS